MVRATHMSPAPSTTALPTVAPPTCFAGDPFCLAYLAHHDPQDLTGFNDEGEGGQQEGEGEGTEEGEEEGTEEGGEKSNAIKSLREVGEPQVPPPPPSPPPAPPSDDEAEEVEAPAAVPALPLVVVAPRAEAGVVWLHGVNDTRFRNSYAALMSSMARTDGRVPVRILPIPVHNVPPQSPGVAITVRPEAFGAVPSMMYYTRAHPVVSAWIAQHATPEALAAHDVPAAFANSDVSIELQVPQGSLAARFYFDFQPPMDMPDAIRLLEVNSGEYERDALPGSGATAALFEDRIIDGELPPPELCIVHGKNL